MKFTTGQPRLSYIVHTSHARSTPSPNQPAKRFYYKRDGDGGGPVGFCVSTVLADFEAYSKAFDMPPDFSECNFKGPAAEESSDGSDDGDGGGGGFRSKSPRRRRRSRRARSRSHCAACLNEVLERSDDDHVTAVALCDSARRKLSKKKTSNQNFDMRHRPNESTHTEVETGIRLLSSCISRIEQKIGRD